MDEAQIRERAERYDRETRICEGYAANTRVYLLIAAASLVISSLFSEGLLLTKSAWVGTIIFGGLYQYFGFRYLENLGTRYDLLPVVTRARLLNDWANKPIFFYVLALVSFCLAAIGLVFEFSEI